MSRMLKIGAIALVVIAVVVVGLLYYRFDSPALGQSVADAVEDATGARLQADGFTLQIARGLTARDLTVTMETPGADLRVHLDELVLQHRLWPLLRGKVEVQQVVLDRPVVELISKPVPPAAEAPPPPGEASPSPVVEPPLVPEPAAPAQPGRTMRLAVERFAINDGHVIFRTEGQEQPQAEVHGLTLALADLVVDPAASPSYMGLSGKGSLAIASMAWAGQTFTDATGAIVVSRGRTELTDVGLRTALGVVSLDEAVLDLTTAPFSYRIAVSGRDLDLNNAVGAAGQRALGVANLVLTGEGRGPDPTAFQGAGRLSLAAGSLPDLPPLRTIDASLEAGVVGARYEATDVAITVADGRLTLTPFTLKSDLLTLDLAGGGDVTGRLDLDGRLRLPTKYHHDVDVQPITLHKTASAVSYRIGAAARTIDVGRLLGVTEPGFGAASLAASATGDGLEPDDLKADGTLQLTAGTLPAMKALALLDRVLGTSVVGTPYQATAVRFALAGNDLTLQPFTITGGNLRLGVAGTLAASGPIALRVSVAVPRATVRPDRELPQQTLDALTDRSGWMAFPVVVSGTLNDPSLAPDMDAIKQAVARAAKAAVREGAEKVERAVAEQLGGLIRRRSGG